MPAWTAANLYFRSPASQAAKNFLCSAELRDPCWKTGSPPAHPLDLSRQRVLPCRGPGAPAGGWIRASSQASPLLQGPEKNWNPAAGTPHNNATSRVQSPRVHLFKNADFYYLSRTIIAPWKDRAKDIGCYLQSLSIFLRIGENRGRPSCRPSKTPSGFYGIFCRMQPGALPLSSFFYRRA